jgi:CubicO group peptidase (beta-lactamase class C family)
MNQTMNIIFRIISFTILLSAFSFKATAADKIWPQTIPQLQAAIESVLKETKTPGAGIAIVSREKAEWVTGVGKADAAANLPATADTLFRIGSVSKGFVALSALQLQEEGKLKLTDTMRQWVPDVIFVNPWESNNPVRLVNLMEHTSGFDDIHLREYALDDPTPMPLKEALAFGASSRVCRWPPGSRMSYCNSGPAVLAAVIEKVSGEHFEDYVQKHFFNPLHMDTASYFYTPAVQLHLTKLYHSDGITPYPYWHIAYRAAGSINASPKDMANYVRFYLQRGSLDGAQLLEPASIERLETPETLPSAKLGRMAGYGLYNWESCEGAFVFHGHQGGVLGGLTDMAYLPESGCGYAIMLNSGSERALTRISELVRHYIIRGLTPPDLPPVANVPADVQQHYEGYYQDISPRVQMFYGAERLLATGWIGFTTNSASVIGLSRTQMVPVTDRLFRKKDQSIATLALLPDRDGETLIQYRWMTFKKVSGWRVWGEIFGVLVGSLLILSSPIFALVWGSRKLWGKLHHAGPLSLRLIPLLSTLFLGAFWGLIFSNRENLWALGNCCLVSITIMFSSLVFALTAVMSLYLAARHRHAPMNRFAYWHSVLTALAVSGVAVYMGYWGWIGLRLWD